MMTTVTLGFSLHRPEMINLMADWMRRHDVIILEEPPDDKFRPMLEGDLSVDDYLSGVEVEYPEFSRRSCLLMRDLHRSGKRIYQVEPFLQHLLSIHLRFAQGDRPHDLSADPLLNPVYQAERDATKALLDFYQVSTEADFKNTIASVLEFARLDAARFRLRDRLRSRALARRLTKERRVFIEAGAIHLALLPLLRRSVVPTVRIAPVSFNQMALNTMGRRGQLFSPGDQLTLIHIFHPKAADTPRMKLLAARSLVYSKIVPKVEQLPAVESFPHLCSELTAIRMVTGLTMQDCKRLFPLLRRMKSQDAGELVSEYLQRYGKEVMIRDGKAGKPCRRIDKVPSSIRGG